MGDGGVARIVYSGSNTTVYAKKSNNVNDTLSCQMPLHLCGTWYMPVCTVRMSRVGVFFTYFYPSTSTAVSVLILPPGEMQALWCVCC